MSGVGAAVHIGETDPNGASIIASSPCFMFTNCVRARPAMRAAPQADPVLSVTSRGLVSVHRRCAGSIRTQTVRTSSGRAAGVAVAEPESIAEAAATARARLEAAAVDIAAAVAEALVPVGAAEARSALIAEVAAKAVPNTQRTATNPTKLATRPQR